MMESELKPVPCGCGGEATVEYWVGRWYVRCQNANCLISTKNCDTEAEAITTWNRAMGERTAKALNRELDAVVRFEEGGVTFTYDKGTSILHECESCGTFVKPGEIYCHNCGARLEWE